MKRTFILLTLLLFAAPVFAFDAVSTVGAGWIMQKNIKSGLGYYLGFQAPVVTKQSAGYLLLNQTTYLYSDFSLGEIQALRSYAFNQKYLYWDSTWTAYIGLGGGFWQFFKTEGGDEIYGAVAAIAGIGWRGVDWWVGFDVLPIEGSDIMFANTGLSLSF